MTILPDNILKFLFNVFNMYLLCCQIWLYLKLAVTSINFRITSSNVDKELKERKNALQISDKVKDYMHKSQVIQFGGTFGVFTIHHP